jgi:hypothetical protein
MLGEELRKNVNRLNRACQADGLPTMPDLGGRGDSRCRYDRRPPGLSQPKSSPVKVLLDEGQDDQDGRQD